MSIGGSIDIYSARTVEFYSTAATGQLLLAMGPLASKPLACTCSEWRGIRVRRAPFLLLAEVRKAKFGILTKDKFVGGLVHINIRVIIESIYSHQFFLKLR